jgi:hypothetical protein
MWDFFRATNEGEGAAVKVLLIDPPSCRLIGFYGRYSLIGTRRKNGGRYLQDARFHV